MFQHERNTLSEILLKKEITRAPTITSYVRCCCHLKRVNYATAAIKKSLIPCPIKPSPCEDYKWIVKNGLLQIQWICGWKSVTDELIELILSCSCLKPTCLGNQCVCRSHGLPCADLYNCDL